MMRAWKNVMKCLGVLAVVSLAGCATYPEQQYQLAQKEYQQQDYHLAFQHLYQAAKDNDRKAQYALGYLYYYGLGVAQNAYLSRLWLYRSASFGNKKALAALKVIDRVTPDALMLQLKTTPAVRHGSAVRLPAPHATALSKIPAPRRS
jgi:TPR repeat protein